MVGTAIRCVALARVAHRTAESENRSMYASSLNGNREIPGVTGCHPQPARSGKAEGRTLDMYASGKSDGGILSMKRTNKGAQSRQRRDQPPAEYVEKRPPAEGNRVQTTVTGTQGLEAASIGLSRVREAVKRVSSSRPWWGRHKVPYRLHRRVFIYTMSWTSWCGMHPYPNQCFCV